MSQTRTRLVYFWSLTIAGFLLLGGLITVLCANFAMRTENKQERETSRQTLPEEPIAISPTELFDTYCGNAMAADQRFKGKLLKVTDHHLSIEPDSVGFTVALPGTPQIVCYVPPQHRKAFANLHRRKPPFSVIGRCRGIREEPSAWYGKAVVLEECRLAE